MLKGNPGTKWLNGMDKGTRNNNKNIKESMAKMPSRIIHNAIGNNHNHSNPNKYNLALAKIYSTVRMKMTIFSFLKSFNKVVY